MLSIFIHNAIEDSRVAIATLEAQICLFTVVFYLEVEHRSGHHFSSILYRTLIPRSLLLFFKSSLSHQG